MAYLRNNGIVSETEYRGLTIDEATKYAEDGGFVVRIVEVDGRLEMLDTSIKVNRVNLRIRGGKVYGAYTG